MYPKNQGFYMPAEWSPHQRTFLSWPMITSMSFPEEYEHVCKHYYAELAKAIAEFEPVIVIVDPDDEEQVRELIQDKNIDFLNIPHDDAWLRDNGPTFVVNNEGDIAGINWLFNAWGQKYSRWDLDNEVASRILYYYDIKRFDAPFVLEGGSIHSDGEGTLLTTEECLLNPNRNPGLTKEQIEKNLNQYLGINKVIWLKRGLFGDETDGHVDNVACFAAPGKILFQVCNDSQDENCDITQENFQILSEATDAKGRRFEIIQIQQPSKVVYKDNRLTLSYLNFYFVNGGIILPVFGSEAKETNKLAEQILRDTFPDRRIRRIDGMPIIKEGGNVHCTTQQMPAAKYGSVKPALLQRF